jgi:hypothetical protein
VREGRKGGRVEGRREGGKEGRESGAKEGRPKEHARDVVATPKEEKK